MPSYLFQLDIYVTVLPLFRLSFLRDSCLPANNNACTLVPTVFRWHKKMEFKFHFYFSFFFGLEKWNSISISIFHFLCTCDIEKRIWISFFVFRFRISLKNGFEFRFSYFVYRLTLKNGFEFRFSCFVFASLWIIYIFFRNWKNENLSNFNFFSKMKNNKSVVNFHFFFFLDSKRKWKELTRK